jgi:NAD(P)-dependent dehydrogenase (short-subunit alcohol dehydrogenase family)
MSTVLIVGANRGIGLALAQQHAARGDRVIAACRETSPELDATGARVLAQVDVRSDASVAALAGALAGERLDRVLVVAGILSREGLAELDSEGFERIRTQLEVNAIGPLRLLHALRPLLADGARVGILTSRMGSMADNGSGGYYGYRMSKAAVNAAGRSLAMDLREQGVTVLLLHPGYVRTDMTGGNGDVSADESAAGLIARMDEATLADTGSFVHANGTQLPW